jgi:hypothetical protein
MVYLFSCLDFFGDFFEVVILSRHPILVYFLIFFNINIHFKSSKSKVLRMAECPIKFGTLSGLRFVPMA